MFNYGNKFGGTFESLLNVTKVLVILFLVGVLGLFIQADVHIGILLPYLIGAILLSYKTIKF